MQSARKPGTSRLEARRRPGVPSGPVSRFRLSPSAYRRITLLALLALAFIIVTGATVRITGSGLGCPDWPNCKQNRLVAEWDRHQMVEFVNRVITGVVSAAVIVAVLGSLVRSPRRRDLTLLSWGLVVGVALQVGLGALAVIYKLKPQVVMAHFLLSSVLLANATVLHHRAGRPDGGGEEGAPDGRTCDRSVAILGRLVLAAAAATIFLGTIVTSTGPHGGDEHVERLGFTLPAVARVHGTSVAVFLILTLVTIRRLVRTGAPAGALRRAEILLGVSVAQAAVGYTQYFTGVPAVLVGVHVAGAVAVWVATLWFFLGLPGRATSPAGERQGPLPAELIARS